MTYRTLDDLADAMYEAMRLAPSDRAAIEMLKTDPEMRLVSKLMNLYFEALRNPPDGVIGVGAITYAEKKLCDFQQ